MANIKKSFNFRNGVQVDEDNLLVTPTGLVAIGKTIPTEALDVIGNVVVSGVTSSVFTQTGFLTVTTLEPTKIIGAGVSIQSGIITNPSMDNTGIVTYYGDGRFLQGLPTSQWEDTNAGFGVSSIYNTGGTVGIATTNPQFSLQVGNNPNDELPGVGIASEGNINAHGNIRSKSIDVGNNIQLGNAGIITAASFVGNVAGNATGLSGNPSITIKDLDADGHTDLDNVSISGVVTATTFVGALTGNATSADTIDVTAATNSANYFVTFVDQAGAGRSLRGDSGIIYNPSSNDLSISGKFTAGGLDVSRHTELDNVRISGVTTFSGAINADGGASIDNIQIGVTGDNEIDTSTGNLTIDSSGGTITIDDNLTISGETNAVNVVASGVITATTELNSPLIGVGTNDPANDIQVRKNGNVEIQVTSDTGTAGITVGRESGTNNTNNAELRYGKVSNGAPYSSAQSLDLLNYGTGNFNYHLSANNAGAVAGDFHWHRGINNSRLMTLTGIGGSLGIGITTPSDELHVIGGATVSGNITVGNNLNVSGNIVGDVQGTLIGNVSGTLAGNTNTTVGISTLNNLSVAGIATVASLRANKFAVGENPNLDLVSIFISNTNKVFVNDVGQVGIKTTIALPGVGVNGSSTNAVFNAIGVGVTEFTSAAVDLRDAGTATSRYMMPPRVNTSQRANLVNVESGAIIYNTSENKLQVYVGTGSYNVFNWQNLH